LILVMGYYDGDWSAGDWLAMVATMLLFWGMLIALVLWAVRSIRGGGQQSRSGHTETAVPDDILAARYARGEIDDEEFQRRRELLRDTSGSGTRPRSTP
jgi:putative membrane protein